MITFECCLDGVSLAERSWAPHADVFAVDYDTLTENPSKGLKEIVSFIGTKANADVAPTNSTKLAHDWSSVENLDEYTADPRWTVSTVDFLLCTCLCVVFGLVVLVLVVIVVVLHCRGHGGPVVPCHCRLANGE